MIAFLKSNKYEIVFSVILAILCVLALFDFYNDVALAFVESNFSFALTNIGVVAGLKIITGILPLSDGIADILDKIFGIFLIANLLIGIEYIMLLVNKLVFFKVIIVVLFFARFILPRFRKNITAILMLLLFFNPGLNLYINGIASLSNTINADIQKDIDIKILDIKKHLGVVTPPDVTLNDSRTSTQKFIGNLGLFSSKVSKGSQKALDIITSPIDSTKNAIDAIKNDISSNIIFIANTLNVALKLIVQYILNVFFLYFLMPLLYFYVVYKVVKKCCF